MATNSRDTFRGMHFYTVSFVRNQQITLSPIFVDVRYVKPLHTSSQYTVKVWTFPIVLPDGKNYGLASVSSW